MLLEGYFSLPGRICSSYVDEIDDTRLLTIAAKRIPRYDLSSLISAADVNRESDISSEDFEESE